MAEGTPFKDGPAYITTTSDDLYSPAAGTYALIFQIHVANTTGSSALVSLYVGATGAEAGGTELCKDHSIAANSEFDLYFPSGLYLSASDFLVGDADASSELTCTIIGEKFVTL